MSSIVEILNSIRDEFSVFNDPRDKYIFLVDLAKDLGGLTEEEKVEANRIHGCTSQAWVTLLSGPKSKKIVMEWQNDEDFREHLKQIYLAS